MLAVKMMPHLLCFAGVLLFLLRGFSGRRGAVVTAASAGFALGLTAVLILLRSYPPEFTFALVRGVVGAGFLAFWGVAVAAIYRSTGHDLPMAWWDRLAGSTPFAAAASLTAAAAAGAICACRLTGGAGTPLVVFLLVLSAAVLAWCAHAVERVVPQTLAASPAGLMAAVVALLLFSASSLTRLDLFSPLTMKVMKFTHDFVHQFFESMLIPDHGFIRPNLWGYIGLLFGQEVGFWGALIILFVPLALVLLAINLERLPSVAHIRQGAQRRKILAAALGSRRRKLVIPLLSLVIVGAAIYRSLNPSVEYWDPKPVPVTASPAGDVFIPKKGGDIDLEDGKLHKFLFTQGGREARFFVVLNPAGALTVCLDACAICKPDGYGQAEGAVICYYCKTLIPMETVGKPGGCNPIPVPSTVKDDGVHIDTVALMSAGGSTAQAGKGGGK